jgi:hypothetical protein
VCFLLRALFPGHGGSWAVRLRVVVRPSAARAVVSGHGHGCATHPWRPAHRERAAVSAAPRPPASSAVPALGGAARHGVCMVPHPVHAPLSLRASVCCFRAALQRQPGPPSPLCRTNGGGGSCVVPGLRSVAAPSTPSPWRACSPPLHPMNLVCPCAPRANTTLPPPTVLRFYKRRPCWWGLSPGPRWP